jgi:hypothetical protein
MSEKTAEKQPSNGQLTAEQMRQVIAADEAAQAQACLDEINEVLKRRGYALLGVPQLAPDGRIVAVVHVMPISQL